MDGAGIRVVRPPPGGDTRPPVLPDLTVLLAVILGLAAWSVPGSAPATAPFGTLLLIAVSSGLCRMAAARGREAAAQGDLAGAAAAARLIGLWPLLAWIAALQFFAWGPWVTQHIPRVLWMVPLLVVLLPAGALFAAAWIARAEVEGAVARTRGLLPRTEGPGAAVRAGLKRNALILLPILLITGVAEALHVAGELGVAWARSAALWVENLPLLQLALYAGLFLLLVPFLPAIVARATRARPLAPGPLRERLEAAARAIRLDYRDLYVWDTGGRIVNALVVGFGRTRRILITDRLLADLPEEEVEAVFLHEAGHAKRRHLPLYLVIFLTVALWLDAVQAPLLAIGLSPFLILLLHLAFFWFVLLGLISRRFEREADLFAVDFAERVPQEQLALPGILTPLPATAVHLVRAFERLRRATGGQSPAHRHGTLDDRMRMVAAYASSEEVRVRQRRIGRQLRVGIAVAALGAGALTLAGLPAQVDGARGTILTGQARHLEQRALVRAEADDLEAARELWTQARALLRRAAALGPDATHAAERRVAAAGISFDHLGDREGARQDLDALPAAGAHEDLARVWTAFHAETLRARLEAAEGHAAAAEAAYQRAQTLHLRLAGAPEVSGAMRRWVDEVLRLARAGIDAQAPAGPESEARHALARQRLAALAGGRDAEPEWRELRRIAAAALKALGPP